MNTYLVAIHRLLPVLALLFVSAGQVIAQDPKPIRAEEARLELTRQVPISTEVTGRLRTVNPSRLGARVRMGDLMIEVEDELIKCEVAEAQSKADSEVEIKFAVVAKEKAELDLAQRREANLKREKSFSDNEIRQSELEVQKTEAQRKKSIEDKEVLNLTLATKTTQLAQYNVYAPFDGIVTKIQRWPGQSVRPGDPVLTVTDMSILKAVLKVDFRRRSEVFEGDKVEIKIDVAGRTIRGDALPTKSETESTEGTEGDDLFNRRGGPFVAEPTNAATQEGEVFEGTISLIEPTLEKKSNTVLLLVDVEVPNRKDKYGRYLLQEGLPIEAIILPKKRN
ncbi:MAG TPA: HlyD family efflux transporter periplasmic adaptor subunit [Planctomycetaceae bacterium]|nr:HlyD family efflux transporter periplasmic adaptor subunit [Planctomycetaceae bacterium]